MRLKKKPIASAPDFANSFQSLLRRVVGGGFGGFNLFERSRMHLTLWMTAGAVGRNVRKAFLVHDGFCHDGTGGIAVAKEEHIERLGISAAGNRNISVATRRGAAARISLIPFDGADECTHELTIDLRRDAIGINTLAEEKVAGVLDAVNSGRLDFDTFKAGGI